MRSLGYAPEDAQHTRIPGLWRKISQWYDLNALDERENSYAFRDYGDPLDADDWDDIPRFTLPEEDYGHLIFPRRVRERGSGGSSSPPFIPVEEDNALYQPGIGLLSDLPDRAKSWRAGSASTTRTNSKTTKSTRAEKTTAKNAKGAKSGPAAVNAKAQSAVSDSAEEDDEEEGDEEEDEDSSESEAEPAPSTRRTNRSGGRAKPAPKRTRKR
jgi:MRG-binding protein